MKRIEARPASPSDLGFHDWNDPSRIRQLLTARVAPQQPVEPERREVDVLVERVHRRDDLLVEIEEVVRLGERQLDGQLAEQRRVLAVAARVAVMKLHDVVVHARQRLLLVVVPEGLGVGADALVHHPLAVGLDGEPPGRDSDHLVVAEPIQIRSDHELGLERLSKDLLSRGRGGDDRVGRGVLVFGRFEPNRVRGPAEIAREDLVDRERLLKPAKRRVHRLLLPLGRGTVPRKGDREPRRAGAFELRTDVVVEPRVPLLVGGEDPDVRVIPSSLRTSAAMRSRTSGGSERRASTTMPDLPRARDTARSRNSRQKASTSESTSKLSSKMTPAP